MKFLAVVLLIPSLAWGAGVGVSTTPVVSQILSWTAPTIDTGGGVPVIDHYIVSWTNVLRQFPLVPIGSVDLPAGVSTFNTVNDWTLLQQFKPCGVWYFQIQSVTSSGTVSDFSKQIPFQTGNSCPNPPPVYPTVPVSGVTLQ